MVDTYLALAEAAGCAKEPPRLQLAVTPNEAAVGQRIWDTLGLRTDGRVVALNNSGAYGAAKRWPLEHCGTLARLIAAELDHDVLMICGPGEEAVGREVVARAAHPRVFSLAGQQIGLATTKSCLARCRLMVSTDSGPRHVGAALGLPVVTLLGPTLPVWIDNPTIRGCHIRIELDCLGCSRRVCPLGHHRCMKDLSPRMVFQSVAGELKRLHA
jgi:heptosyltransferase-2